MPQPKKVVSTDGSIYTGDNTSTAVMNPSFWVQLTAYDGSKYYSWTEQTAQGGSFSATPGGRFGTYSVNPCYEVNGVVITTPTYVRIRRAYFDHTYQWVFLIEAESQATGGGGSLTVTDGTYTDTSVTTIHIDAGTRATGLTLIGSGTASATIETIAATATQQGTVNTANQIWAGVKFAETADNPSGFGFTHGAGGIEGVTYFAGAGYVSDINGSFSDWIQAVYYGTLPSVVYKQPPIIAGGFSVIDNVLGSQSNIFVLENDWELTASSKAGFCFRDGGDNKLLQFNEGAWALSSYASGPLSNSYTLTGYCKIVAAGGFSTVSGSSKLDGISTSFTVGSETYTFTKGILTSKSP